MKASLPVISLLLLSLFLGCSPKEKKVKATMETPPASPAVAAGPPTILYKSRKDYRQQVPVLLSADKAEIVSYPHPADVFWKGSLAYPTRLKNGYLLDNRGINQHVAFLSLTYAEYSQLPRAPSLSQLREMIIDQDPITEMWECGNRNQYTDEVKELNALIESNSLSRCRKLK
jgi:hypothetical protein